MEQYVKWPPMTERQIDMMQEQLFREYGPFYHLSTKPLEDGLIFECEEERKVAINMMAILAKETHVDILAFAIMSNHFHFIIQGELVDGIEFSSFQPKNLVIPGLFPFVIPGLTPFVIPGLTRNLYTTIVWDTYTL